MYLRMRTIMRFLSITFTLVLGLLPLELIGLFYAEYHGITRRSIVIGLVVVAGVLIGIIALKGMIKDALYNDRRDPDRKDWYNDR